MERQHDFKKQLAHAVPFDMDPVAEVQDLREQIAQDLPDKPFVAPRVASSLIRLGETLAIAAVAIAQLLYYPGLAKVETLWLYALATGMVAMIFGDRRPA